MLMNPMPLPESMAASRSNHLDLPESAMTATDHGAQGASARAGFAEMERKQAWMLDALWLAKTPGQAWAL